MPREVKLSQLDDVLAELSYPVSQDEVMSTLDDVTLLYADGREPLGKVLDRTSEGRFETMDDLRTELYNCLPTAAVGEPGQSEGDA